MESGVRTVSRGWLLHQELSPKQQAFSLKQSFLSFQEPFQHEAVKHMTDCVERWSTRCDRLRKGLLAYLNHKIKHTALCS